MNDNSKPEKRKSKNNAHPHKPAQWKVRLYDSTGEAGETNVQVTLFEEKASAAAGGNNASVNRGRRAA
jgi:hypothetical protein